MISQPAKYHILNSPFLLEGSSNTDFIYKIENLRLDTHLINKLNSFDFNDRYNTVIQQKGSFRFISCNSKMFHSNLIMIDSIIPAILSETILLNYSKRLTNMEDVAKVLAEKNPLYYPNFGSINIYGYKLKEFLRSIALGLNTDNIWHGEPNLYEHMPVIKIYNEVIYYSDSVKRFIETLYTHSTIGKNENISNGEIYIQDGEYFINLNLQIELT